MKKRFLNVILIVLLLVITGCTLEKDNNSYTLDLTLVSEEICINDFDITDIRIIVTDEEGKTKTVVADKTMLSEEDYAKLKTVGTHIVEIKYKKIK